MVGLILDRLRRVFYDPTLTIGTNLDGWHGRATILSYLYHQPVLEQYITYKNKVGNGDLTALLGYSYQEFTNQSDYFWCSKSSYE